MACSKFYKMEVTTIDIKINRVTLSMSLLSEVIDLKIELSVGL